MEEGFSVNDNPMCSIEEMEKIINIMKESICKIKINNEQNGTGFFCNVSMDDWDILRVFITTDFF